MGNVRLPLRESAWVSGSAKRALGHRVPPGYALPLVTVSLEDLSQLLSVNSHQVQVARSLRAAGVGRLKAPTATEGRVTLLGTF